MNDGNNWMLIAKKQNKGKKMKTLRRRAQDLRDGRGWYPSSAHGLIVPDICCYTSNLPDVTVKFLANDMNKALLMAVEYCEYMNEKGKQL